MRTHYFDDDGDGWTALCGKTFTYIDCHISAFGLEDITCNACRRLFLARDLKARGMHPMTADLIMRKAIIATDEQKEMAFKSCFGPLEEVESQS